MFARVVFLVMVYVAADTLVATVSGNTAMTPALFGAIAFVVGAVAFLAVISVTIVFLLHEKRPVDPFRLLSDILISTCVSIFAFALLFRHLGVADSTCDATITASLCEPVTHHPAATLYFSVVTFSTLGYGDLRPMEPYRLLAALEAIIGNLHLGFLTAAIFYSLRHDPRDFNRWRGSARSVREDADDEDS